MSVDLSAYKIGKSQDLLIVWAVREILLGTTETPQSTLAVPIAHGDLSATVQATDVDQFIANGLFSVYGVTDEEHLPISDEWDGASPVIPINWTGMDYVGFQEDHPAGTKVGTNLFTQAPDNLDFMLDHGHPVVFMVMQRHRRYLQNFGQAIGAYTLRIEYRLAETQPRPVGPTADAMNSNTWTFRIQEKARIAMDAFALALESRWTLRVPEVGEVVVAQQDPINPTGEIWTTDWTSVIVRANELQFAGAATLPIQSELSFINT